MSQVFHGNTYGADVVPQPLSVLFQLRALLLLLRPETQEEFERDWNSAVAVQAKGYAPPRLVRVRALAVPTAWALDKNSEETEEYVEVLQAEESQVEQTRYIQEIQLRKHARSLESAMHRARTFRELAGRLEREGIRRPVYLVDVSAYGLPYRMFRFDGHHRAICARFLGLERVPAYVFEVSPPPPMP